MNIGRTELTSNCKFIGGVFVSFDCLCSFDAGHFSPLVHLRKAPFIPINRKKGVFLRWTSVKKMFVYEWTQTLRRNSPTWQIYAVLVKCSVLPVFVFSAFTWSKYQIKECKIIKSNKVQLRYKNLDFVVDTGTDCGIWANLTICHCHMLRMGAVIL